MKKYMITVEGKTYEVEVEEIMENGDIAMESPPKVKAPSKAPTPPQTTKAPVKKAPPVTTAGEEAVIAPLPGTIFAIKVKEGDSVSEGDLLFILEAMKMENEITAPSSGTIDKIHVSEGATVDTDEVLAIIK